MNPKQKRTLILAGIIGTLFACYEESEKTALHRLLHKRIGVGTRRMVKRYGSAVVVQVVHEEGNAIWKDSVDHFSEQKITIEASACVLALLNIDDKALGKHFGLSRAKMGLWAKPTRRADAVELDKQSRAVAKYVELKINALYGIETEKKMSVMERIEMARMSA